MTLRCSDLADPLVCDVTGNDFHLQAGSPCLAPALAPECGDVIGSFGALCGTTSVAPGSPVQPQSWSSLKLQHR